MNQHVVRNIIKEFTYGIRTAETFVDGTHKPEYKFQGWKNEFCDNIFKSFFIKNTSYPVGRVIEHSFCPVWPRQTAMCFDVYVSDSNPQYVTAPGCYKLATITLEMPIPESMEKASEDELIARSVIASFKFNHDMLVVKAVCNTTKKEVQATLNYFEERACANSG